MEISSVSILQYIGSKVILYVSEKILYKFWKQMYITKSKEIVYEEELDQMYHKYILDLEKDDYVIITS